MTSKSTQWLMEGRRSNGLATVRCRHFVLAVSLLAGALGLGSNSAQAGVVVNGFGVGTSTVSGWSALTPYPGPPTVITVTSGPRGFAPSARFNATLNPGSYSAISGPPASLGSVNTFAFASGGIGWSMPMGGFNAGGDSIAGGSGSGLFALVTPTLASASVNLTVSGGTIETSTTVQFTGTFQGDAGTAGSLSFSDIVSPSSPQQLTISNLTGAGTIQADGSLLFLGSGSGNPAQSFSFTVTDPASTDSNYLQTNVQADGEFVGTSVAGGPAPLPAWASIALAGLLATGLLVRAAGRASSAVN